MSNGLQNGIGAKVRDKLLGIVFDDTPIDAREKASVAPHQYEVVPLSTPSVRQVLGTKGIAELWDLVPKAGHSEALNVHASADALRVALERMVRAGTVTLPEFATR